MALVISAATRLIGDAAGRGELAAAPLPVATTAQPVNEEAERLDREARLAPTPRPEVLTRRESLIAGAVSRARAMGEASPRLVALRATTVRDLATVLYKGAEGERSNLGPDSRRLCVSIHPR